jgi:tetratricopeptide (TPR) repeat protein
MPVARTLCCTVLMTGLVLPLSAVQGAPANQATRPGVSESLSWRDLDGREHSARADARATVLVFGSTECPCADEYVERVAGLAGDYAGKGARFFLVFSNPSETEPGVRAYAARRKLAVPAVLDADRKLAERLGADVTPAAVLLDRAGKIRYAGQIDDSPDVRLVKQQYLREALEDVLRGRAVRHARTDAFGCAVAPETGTAPPERPVRLIPGLGKVRFNATTRSPEAQQFFQQGVALWYGFNFDEAERSFREAARLDPECAMAYWGTALSLGMNYNWDFDPSREGEVYRITRRALELAPKATERERLLIQALARRHSEAPNPDRQKLLGEYVSEMRRIHQSLPADSEVAVFFAASMMDLRPWDLWTWEGQPKPGTLEIVAVLERVLKKDPNHIGANHLYIHAMEAGLQPERALRSARRLAALAPRSGHLVHMPAHIFQRVGDFRSAARSNRDGADIDSPYIASDKISGRYIAYYIHNLDFLAFSHSMAGRSADAMATARELAEAVARHRPAARGIMCPSASLVASDVLVRFRRWDDILKAPEPPQADMAGRLFDVYARGMALVSKGDRAGAEKALQQIDAAAAAIGPAFATGAEGTPYAKAGPLLIKAARSMLAGKIALARGDVEGGIRALREGIAAEDELPYAEPAMWRAPIRETLGGALLRASRPAEAETVFRDDLRRNRGSGRSLFGLMKSLEAQGRKREARKIEKEFNKAWQHADVQLTAASL